MALIRLCPDGLFLGSATSRIKSQTRLQQFTNITHLQSKVQSSYPCTGISLTSNNSNHILLLNPRLLVSVFSNAFTFSTKLHGLLYSLLLRISEWSIGRNVAAILDMTFTGTKIASTHKNTISVYQHLKQKSTFISCICFVHKE